MCTMPCRTSMAVSSPVLRSGPRKSSTLHMGMVEGDRQKEEGAQAQ